MAPRSRSRGGHGTVRTCPASARRAAGHAAGQGRGSEAPERASAPRQPPSSGPRSPPNAAPGRRLVRAGAQRGARARALPDPRTRSRGRGRSYRDGGTGLRGDWRLGILWALEGSPSIPSFPERAPPRDTAGPLLLPPPARQSADYLRSSPLPPRIRRNARNAGTRAGICRSVPAWASGLEWGAERPRPCAGPWLLSCEPGPRPERPPAARGSERRGRGPLSLLGE